jgi:hypothetical protein
MNGGEIAPRKYLPQRELEQYGDATPEPYVQPLFYPLLKAVAFCFSIS